MLTAKKRKNNDWVCIGYSHWKDGKFSTKHGNVTNKLALGYLKIVERYGNKGNWRNYSWLEEMRGEGIMRLSQVGLGFNEKLSQNPFAYFTTVISHSFTSVLNKEKELLNVKNKFIVDSGYDPSFNDQAEWAQDNYMRDQNPEKEHEE